MVTYFSEIWHHSGILRAEVNHSLWREMPPVLFDCCFQAPPPTSGVDFTPWSVIKARGEPVPPWRLELPGDTVKLATERVVLSSLAFPPFLSTSPLPLCSVLLLLCLPPAPPSDLLPLACIVSAFISSVSCPLVIHTVFLSLSHPKQFFLCCWSAPQKSSAANVSFSFKGKVCISNWNLIFLHELEAVFFPLRVAWGWSVSHECLRWEVLLACVLEGMLSRGQHSLGCWRWGWQWGCVTFGTVTGTNLVKQMQSAVRLR